MRRAGRALLALALGALRLASLAAQPAEAPAAGVFRQEGADYFVVASGRGASQAEAEERARAAAFRGLFAGLGKDRLFAEVFEGSPPAGLGFTVDSVGREGEAWTASVTLRVDDESLRIVERGPYLAAAVAILDKAEARSAEAESQAARAARAESAAWLGEALGAWGMSRDEARAGMGLVEPLEDGSVFSTAGKRTAPELRRALGAAADAGESGLRRVQEAAASLAKDESGRAASGVVDSSLATADSARSLLEELAPTLADLSSLEPDRLPPLRDRLDGAIRGLADAAAALKRAVAALSEGSGYVRDRAEFARRRLATEDASLAAARRSVDREMRDPAARRAARAQALRWAFFHAPREYLALRAWLPVMVDGREGGEAGAAPWEFSAGMEGAFKLGSGGLWLRTQARLATLDLSLQAPGGEALGEESISQSLDLGLWGRGLFFAGYGWDWIRRADGLSTPSRGQVRLGLGGVSGDDDSRRADWNLAFSWRLPEETGDFVLANLLNLGVEGSFRLGRFALIEASIAHRLHANPSSDSPRGFDAVLAWSLGLGLRLPPPFLIGAEYRGSLAWPLDGGGGVDYESTRSGRSGSFRFFIGYSL